MQVDHEREIARSEIWIRGIPVVTVWPLDEELDHELLIIYGGSREKDFRGVVELYWAEELAQRGYVVHCFDFQSNVKGNDFYQFGLYDRILDATRVTNWLLKRPSRHPLTLIGVSMGGHIATQIAGELPGLGDQITNLILVAPAAYHDSAIQPDLKFSPTEDGEFTRILKQSEKWRESSIFTLARRVRANTLVIAFREDKMVKDVPWKYRDAFLLAMMEHNTKAGFSPHSGGHEGNFGDPKRIKLILKEIVNFIG